MTNINELRSIYRNMASIWAAGAGYDMNTLNIVVKGIAGKDATPQAMIDTLHNLELYCKTCNKGGRIDGGDCICCRGTGAVKIADAKRACINAAKLQNSKMIWG